jgi:hypothetical protein
MAGMVVIGTTKHKHIGGDMKKLLMIFTAMLTLALLLGEIYYPDFPLVWMASDAAGFVFIRAAIVIVLAVLIFSGSVGAAILKPFMPIAAGGLVALTAALLFSDSLSFIDAVIFIETAIVLTLGFLEAKSNPVPAFRTRPVGKFGVGNDFVKIS